MKYIDSLHTIIFREFKRIAERRTLYLLTIFLPAIFFLIFSLIYKKEFVQDLPVAVCDMDNSALSRTVVQYIEATPSMSVVKYLSSTEEIKKGFQKGEIQGAIFIPKDLEKDVKSGHSVNVVVYKNSANIIVGNLILSDAVKTIKTISAGVLLKKFKSAGMTTEQAMDKILPVKIDTHYMYNPNYSYLNYLVPGLLTVTLQLIIMIASVVVISSEFTHETFPELLRIANNKLSVIITGKMIPHFLIHTASVLLIFGVFFQFFNIPVNGSVLAVILFTLWFVLGCLNIGFLISSLFHDQLFATEVAVVLNTPAFIFSGFTFPLWGMPALHSTMAQALPYTHFLTGFLKLYQMGTPLYAVKHEFAVLGLFILIPAILMFFGLKYQINKYYRRGTEVAK